MGEPLTPNTNWINPGDFSRFREYLVKQAGLHADKAATLAKAMPVKLYAAGTIVGIDEAQMAKAIAQFLALPYVSHVNPAELQLDILPPYSACCTASFPCARPRGGAGSPLVTRSIGNSWTPSSDVCRSRKRYD